MVRAALSETARVVKELGDGLLLWFATRTTRSARACVSNTTSTPSTTR